MKYIYIVHIYDVYGKYRYTNETAFYTLEDAKEYALGCEMYTQIQKIKLWKLDTK